VYVEDARLVLVAMDENGISVTVWSDETFEVATNPTQVERVVGQLRKSGDTEYDCYEVEYHDEMVLFIPSVRKQKKMIRQQDSEKLNRLVSCVKSLNEAIREDPSLGEGVCIGHSYFCPANKPFDDNMLHNIVEYELIPLLKEYWYDEPEKVREWSEKLRSALQ